MVAKIHYHMVTKYKDKTVKGPNQFVITGYCNVKDVTKTAQPYFKRLEILFLYRFRIWKTKNRWQCFLSSHK